MFDKTKETETDKAAEQKPKAKGTGIKPKADLDGDGETSEETGLQTVEQNSPESLFAYAKNAKGIEVTAEYLELKQLPENENVIFIFLGMTTYNAKEKGNIPAVKLMSEDKKQWILASTVVVTALERIKEDVPCPVGITCKGKVKGNNGDYYDCTVVRY